MVTCKTYRHDSKVRPHFVRQTSRVTQLGHQHNRLQLFPLKVQERFSQTSFTERRKQQFIPSPDEKLCSDLLLLLLVLELSSAWVCAPTKVDLQIELFCCTFFWKREQAFLHDQLILKLNYFVHFFWKRHFPMMNCKLAGIFLSWGFFP